MRSRIEAEMVAELRQHLEELTRRNIAEGMAPDDARFAAQRSFGGIAQIEERCRDAHGFVWLAQLLKDFTFAARSLSRAWGYTLTILFTLVLGISVTTLVYDISGWMIFHSLPYPHPEQLFFVGAKDKQGPELYYHPALFLEAYREQAADVAQFVAEASNPTNVVINGEPIATFASNVSAETFDMLGIKPSLGRGFMNGDDRDGSDGVVVISDRFWKEHFGGSPDVLGKKITIDQQVCLVIGVLAKNQELPFYFGGDILKPLVLKPDPKDLFAPGIFIMARLRPGVTTGQALAVLAKVKFAKLPMWAVTYFKDRRPILSDIRNAGRHDSFWVILAAGAFLCSIAWLNAINLMLIRLLKRRRELSIRFAVGGSRWQVLRVLLVECVVLSSAACIISITTVYWSLPIVMRALYGDDYSLEAGFWTWGELKFVVELSALTWALTAIAPTVRLLRSDVSSGLRDGGPTTGESRHASRFRTLLVVLQAAFAVVLLIGTGLMVRSFQRLQHVELGFNPVGKVKVRVQFPNGYELGPEAKLQLYEHIRMDLSKLPGVRAVSYAEDALLNDRNSYDANMLMADGTLKRVPGDFVDPEFQQAGGLVMKRGRWLSGKSGLLEVVINERLASIRFGNADPVGQSVIIDLSGKKPYTVVGVAGDVRSSVRSAMEAWFYAPAWQRPTLINTFILRLDGDPEKGFSALVRRTIYGSSTRLGVCSVQSIGEQIDVSMWAERLACTMLKGLAVVALLLTVIGLYSVVSFTVDSRMTEFGVRVAVGANDGDLIRMVMHRGLAATGIGILIGVTVAVGMTRFMRSLLFETEPFDPIVYLAVAMSLLLAAACASWLPARRAARVDVVKLLRAE